jgi:hypothetical protein
MKYVGHGDQIELNLNGPIFHNFKLTPLYCLSDLKPQLGFFTSTLEENRSFQASITKDFFHQNNKTHRTAMTRRLKIR